MEPAEIPPEPVVSTEKTRIRVDLTLPVPVGLWVQRQAGERYMTVSGYVRSIVVAMYRRDQGSP